ncbi:hypothetical protein, partial [Deinococcus geothermalis]|uniref:hypothetical protein n=1 Tax=Deinococcus geothermalis TaxID=68909 RepID=UPI002356D570
SRRRSHYRLGDLLNIQLPQGALANVNLDVLDLITGTIQLYNYRNVATTPQPITVDTAALGLNGVTNLQLYVQVVEPPVYVCGRAGASFHTAALRLKLNVSLLSGLNTSSLVTAVTNLLSGLTVGITNVQVEQLSALQVSLYVEVAKAEGTLAGVDLVSGAVTLQARPGLVNLYLGDIADNVFFNRSHVLTSTDVTPKTATTVRVRLRVVVLVPIADVTIDLGVQLRAVASGNPELMTQTYTAPFPQTRTFSSSTVTVGTLVTSLLNQLQVSLTPNQTQVTLLGALPLPIPLDSIVNPLLTGLVSPIASQLSALLSPVLTTVLGGLVDPLLQLLGIQLGQATFSVMGISSLCPISGTVYRDLQPDGVRNNGENWSTGPNVYVNLVQNNQVLQSLLVTPGSGAYTFNDVPPGTFTLLVTTAAGAVTPIPPAGWLFVEPNPGLRTVTVLSTPLLNQDFGLFAGTRLQGLVFLDQGQSGGIPNDARQNGQEPPVAGVSLRLNNATQTVTASTGTDGRYTLYWPAEWGNTGTLTVLGRPVTGVSDGTTVTQTADLAGSNVNGLPLDVTPGQDLIRSFGVVEFSVFTADASGRSGAPGRVRYTHFYRPGTLGTVNLSANGTAGVTYRFARDLKCNGVVEDAERTSITSFVVDQSWPREPDGRLRSCALEVEVQIPAGQPNGSIDTATLTATLSWSGSPVQDPRSLTDTTSITPQATLTKKLRNLTRNSEITESQVEAYPNETLEYCLEYQNLSGQTLNQLVLNDTLPTPLVYLPGTLRRDGLPLTDAADSDDGEVNDRQLTVRLASLAAGATGNVCFQVRVP